MRETLLLGTIFVLMGFSVDYRRISGIVKDAGNNRPLAGASIKILESAKGVVTDQNGVFSIDVANDPSDVKVVISSTGYKTDTLMLCSTVAFHTLFLEQVAGTLTDVTVRTDRQKELRENPVAITSVPALKIDRTLQSNIIDVLVKNVPGLNAVKTGPNISKPFIRGLGYNRVLTLYDGIRQEGQQWGDEHGIEIDPYGLQKAEVLKGPVSLIYGSDALAGVVSLIPFRPKDQTGNIRGRLTSEYQQNNGLIGNGIRLYSSNRNWYFLGAGSYRMAKNFQNPVDGRVYNTNFKEASATVSLGHTGANGKSTINLTLFNDRQGIPDGSRDSLTRKFTKQIYEGDRDNIKDRPVVSDQQLNSYRLSPLHQRIQHYRIYSNNQYKLRHGEVEASIAWQQNIRQEFSHPTITDQAGMYVRLNTLNFGFKYTLPVWQNLDLTIGVNGMNQGNKNKDATDFPIPDYRLWDIGSFIFSKWKYKHFTFSGGIRYDHRHIDGKPLYTVKNQYTGFDKTTDHPDAKATRQFSRFNKSFHGLSLSLGSTYTFNSHISLKANIARGYRAPNITELAANGLDPGAHIIYKGNMNAQPEFSFQQDLGMDMEYSAFSGSISVFNNYINHYIYLTELSNDGAPLTDAQGNKTFQYQQAGAHLYGLELTANIHPRSLKGLSWNNNLSITYGANTSHLYENKGTLGRYLPHIPPVSWLSNITQIVSLQNKVFRCLTFMTELDYHGSQNRFLGLYNTETATPSYTLVNIGTGVSLQCNGRQRIELQVAINNVMNTTYQSHMSRLKYFEYYSFSPTHRYGIYGPGRNICIKIIFPI
ncbi:TonB-dependent receptor [Arachidicoccus terrestris]|uniref:TonB-dependent receptor n=1 Tax=Arachidicoccus terrestris TaxID=2875539 RepID=UPI001CC77E59|nr:TonB-dependent receptor [Arachidicoccus terrestris]UAY54348.1 TonB-dependent receptor [Arachidicoccus terrestris]